MGLNEIFVIRVKKNNQWDIPVEFRDKSQQKCTCDGYTDDGNLSYCNRNMAEIQNEKKNVYVYCQFYHI